MDLTFNGGLLESPSLRDLTLRPISPLRDHHFAPNLKITSRPFFKI